MQTTTQVHMGARTMYAVRGYDVARPTNAASIALGIGEVGVGVTSRRSGPEHRRSASEQYPHAPEDPATAIWAWLFAQKKQEKSNGPIDREACGPCAA